MGLELPNLRDPVERAFSHYLMIKRSNRLKTSFKDEIDKELSKTIDRRKPRIGLENGLYYNNVKRYMEIFGVNQVKIIIFEEFIKNTKELFAEILEFLGLDISLDDFEFEKHNEFFVPKNSFFQYFLASKSVNKMVSIFSPTTRKYVKKQFLQKEESKPKMNDEDREILKNYYIKDVNNLEKYLGNNLSWKNFIK